MEDDTAPSEAVLKEAIMNMREPVAFCDMLKGTDGTFIWKLLNWDLPKLAEMFGDKKIPFRVGYNAKSVSPQWEVDCATEFMTLKDFITNTENIADNEKWYYFDYKYMHEWLKDKPDIIESLSWQRFGFDKGGADSTIWIGNKGAHTNCHQDSYGCNLIAQIHGRKQWLLFPPNSTHILQPTRVPYEESTVYSKFNIFAPTKEDQDSILSSPEKPRLITLIPGDVLFVPNGWWHYVESLELSVSVNIWLPVDSDSQSRLEESIVKLIVSRIGKKHCLTPAEHHPTLSYCIDLVEAALEECRTSCDAEDSVPEKRAKYTAWTAEDLSAQYPAYVKQLQALDKIELKKFLAEKRERFSTSVEDLPKRNDIEQRRTDEDVRCSVINALCHPEIVKKVANLISNGCI